MYLKTGMVYSVPRPVICPRGGTWDIDDCDCRDQDIPNQLSYTATNREYMFLGGTCCHYLCLLLLHFTTASTIDFPKTTILLRRSTQMLGSISNYIFLYLVLKPKVQKLLWRYHKCVESSELPVAIYVVNFMTSLGFPSRRTPWSGTIGPDRLHDTAPKTKALPSLQSRVVRGIEFI